MSDNFAIATAQRCARVLYSRLWLFNLFSGGVECHAELMSVFVTECSGVHCDMLTWPAAAGAGQDTVGG